MEIERSAPRRALVLLDFQEDFLADEGRMPVARHQVMSVMAATRTAIDHAHRQQGLIVKIGNEFKRRDVLMNALRRRAAIAGSPGARWDPRFDAENAVYLSKWRSDAFCNPALDLLIAEHEVEQLVVAGLYARACVTATTRGALARGLSVQLITDAIACRTDRSRDAALERLGRLGAELIGSQETHVGVR